MSEQLAATNRQNAEAARATWAKKCEETAARHRAELAELAKESFLHNVGPRQVEEYKAFEIATEEVKELAKAIGEHARTDLMNYLVERRRIARRAERREYSG